MIAQMHTNTLRTANTLDTPGRDAVHDSMIARRDWTRLNSRKTRKARNKRSTLMPGRFFMTSESKETATITKSNKFQALFQNRHSQVPYMFSASSPRKRKENTCSSTANGSF